VDDDLLAYAKTAVGAEHGLSAAQSKRLKGTTPADLHADAKAMVRELGLVDPTQQPRDASTGRYSGEHVDMNELIRGVAGR
jgi:hypothetical protein